MRFASCFTRNVVYPLWVARDKSPRLSYLKSLHVTQYSSLDSLHDLQLKKLQEIVRHAYVETDYYHRLFDEVGVSADSIKSLKDLSLIPFLTKNNIRKNSDALLSHSHKHKHLSIFKTGGSTGVPLFIKKDQQTVELAASANIRSFQWASWKIGEPWGMIWGNPPEAKTLKQKFYRHWINPEIFLDTINLTDKTMLEFVRLWHQVKPSMIRGHSHSIYIFASFCKKQGIVDIRPSGIISSSMMLLAAERAVIEEVFGCKVTDLYGCEEVGLIASECSEHKGMHINMENIIVEIVDKDGNPAAYGEDGEVVVTSLINYAMPLLRYKVGDVASFLEGVCHCGLSLPLMNNIKGRVADFFVRKDGSVIAGVSLVERTLTANPGIAQMQIVQPDIDTILVNLVKDKGYDQKVEDSLIAELKRSIGEYNTIVIRPVESIKPEPSGKYRFAISHVSNPFSEVR